MTKRSITMMIKEELSPLYEPLPCAVTAVSSHIRVLSSKQRFSLYLLLFLSLLSAANPAFAAAPVIGGAVSSQAVDDTATLSPFSGITITDADGDNVTTTITLDDNTKGVLTGTGLSGTGPYTLASSTPAAAQAAIRALVFDPAENRVNVGQTETTTFTISVDDTIDVPTVDNSTSVVSTSINQAGSITLPTTGVSQGNVLTATVVDTDGVPGSISYAWTSGGGAVGTDSDSYTVQQSDVDNVIAVTATYTDLLNQAEVVASNNTNAVLNTNDAPQIGGAVSSQAVDDTATLSPFGGITITDADGDNVTTTITLDDNTKGVLTGTGLSGTGPYTLASSTPAAAQSAIRALVFDPAENRVNVGQTETTTFTISVDDTIATPTVDSDTSVVSTSINDDPVIGGTVAAQPVNDNVTLSPFNTVTITDVDADDVSITISLDINAKGVLSGAGLSGTGPYTLAASAPATAQASIRALVFDPADNRVAVGLTETTAFTISVNDSTVTINDSITTVVSTSVNVAPTGLPVISGTVTEGQQLTADPSAINDDDGVGAFSYQWKRGGVNVGVDANTYTLVQADVGSTMAVEVSYTDAGGSNESVESAATVVVANFNDTGVATITGTAEQGQLLSAGITDADGTSTSTFSYQWKRNNVAIGTATNSTYTLTQDDVDSTITVTIDYVDDLSTAESVTSPATAIVTDINDAPAGSPVINGTVTQGQQLIADTTSITDADGLGSFSYQWKRGGVNVGTDASTYTLGQADVGNAITVEVSYLDGGGTTESLTSAATAAVANVNDGPVGLPTISGIVTEGQVLNAVTSGISDADGTTTSVFTYQWKRNTVIIGGATNSSYTLVQDDVGSTITVTVDYTDDLLTAESVTSLATTAVANNNDTGIASITGTVAQNSVLTANVSDADGTTGSTFSYQWKRNGANIPAATASTYTLIQDDVGLTITVNVSYTDDQTTAENITSPATIVVANVNDAGVATISGTPEQGSLLTAGITDIDGISGSSFTYIWRSDTVAISGATASTYTPVQADVGKKISVTISYTDDLSTAESVTSAETAVIGDINDAPAGLPVITGVVTQGQQLTADTTAITDADGLGPFSYQWKRGGADIGTATLSTYTLVQADVGQTITVEVSYLDGGGTTETLLSAASTVVANINDAPAGLPTISGTATEGQELTAVTTGITDADGLGSFSYQWKRGGADIGAATLSTYTLVQADVGQIITVEVSYLDGGGTTETLLSAATAAVSNTNNAPTGSPVITGTATQGQILGVVTTSIGDVDGLGPFDYQWKRGGVDIGAATASTYTLVQADVGLTITVEVSYLDGGSTTETLLSAATAAVTNINDAPSGLPVINGVVTEDQVLTVVTSGITDADGLGAFSYQWKRGGVNVGTNATAYTLVQADVGSTLTVVVSYLDGGGANEAVESVATAAVANVNDPGVATISGVATEGLMLTAGITDADGISGSVTYQWKRNNVDIPGAISNTYTLTQLDVGNTITVTIDYTDDQSTVESVTSAATATVGNVNDPGVATITGTASQGSILTAGLSDGDGASGSISYQWKGDNVDIPGATGSTYTLMQSDVATAITVQISYTDDQGTAESPISTPTASITNTNDTGVATITGSATEGQILTATVTDIDGTTGSSFNYQWKRSGVDIPGAISSAYTLVQDDVGATITVTISYTDDFGAVESPTSSATATVLNTNDAGVATITGSAIEGTTLTAGISDEDGISGAITYQWKRTGTNISGATASTYQLVQDDVGNTITVTVSYTDDQATAESVTSAPTASVSNTNDPGVASITGSALQGSLLIAGITDDDGTSTSTFSYQWKRDTVAIGAATNGTYTLTQDDVGTTITVTISYTDDQSTAESVTSPATSVIGNVNDTGVATITGSAIEGQMLAVGVTDDDGTAGSIFNYQWRSGGVDIVGANSSSYTLKQTEVGTTITVNVTYTDDLGMAEDITSAPTGIVANVNDPGIASISGSATEGQLLAAGITDADGTTGSIFSYQWKSNAVDIPGANSSTYLLVQADVGTTITVNISYTDDQSTAESVTSTPTAAVLNVNDDGVVTISGTATEGQVLTTDVSDGDGTSGSSFSYQWKRDASNIPGATTSTYQLVQDDVGSVITVSVTYTDDQSTIENITSAPTTTVINTNQTGIATISGAATEGLTLTAGISDADGTATSSFSYQWKGNGIDIPGAVLSTYTLGQADVGNTITVTIGYTDDQATVESVTSPATSAVANVNDPGVASISGTTTENSVLTANITDEDGISGAISYQWKRDNTNIPAATLNTYSLAQVDVGARISVIISYTDDQGTVENVTSPQTGIVTNTNDPGVASISGSAVQGSLLTAGITDPDGASGTKSYQWKRNTVDIPGATASTYTLDQDDVGTTITVTISYTDDQSTAENVTSPATAIIANVNDTGTASITGSASEGQLLTASVTDIDGTTTSVFNYKWQRNGTDIPGATASTYTLIQDDVGATITVNVTYTDDLSAVENITSPATAVIGNVNDTGIVTISGIATEGQVLTGNVSDEDGTTGSTFSYQWKRDTTDIPAANAATYTLIQDDVGSTITLNVTYGDDYGTAENITSTATAVISNVNDAPVIGGVSAGQQVDDNATIAPFSAVTISDIDGDDVSIIVSLDDNAKGNFTVASLATSGFIGSGPYTLSARSVTAAQSAIHLLVFDPADNRVDAGLTETTTFTIGVNDATVTTNNSVTTVISESINDPGVATITGTTTEGSILSAGISDADGTGGSIFTYQWKRNGGDIGGATASIYTLIQDDVNTTITVTISYTDDLGTAENVTSNPTASISNTNDTGAINITGVATQGSTLTASVTDDDGANGVITYQWKRDASNIPGANSSTYTLVQADVGSAISVTASYTDDLGTPENITSASTAVVANVNDAGTVTINGAASQGSVLSVVIVDADGTSGSTFSYQWKRGGANIPGATASTYQLVQDDVGSTITVSVSYIDDQSTPENITSTATVVILNINDAGVAVISGTAVQGATLNAVVTDEDGLSGSVSYQWRKSGVDIPGANASTYTLVQADVGSSIDFTASYTDDLGTPENVISAATSNVLNVNDTGVVTINGTASQGDTLSASVIDADGTATSVFSYQWKRGGANIPGATSVTYMLVQDDVGSTITVTVGYTDDLATVENITSAATAVVSNTNDAGSVTISGSNVQGSTLTANVSDGDGLTGPVSYQWLRGGADIDGATGNSYILQQTDVSSSVSVAVSYTDDQGTLENVTSAGTAVITNVNDTGSVVINGTATQGNILSAVVTDIDGTSGSTFSFQWKRNGADISGATSNTYTLEQLDVGNGISVTVGYVDDFSQAENITSASTLPVVNINDVGVASITGVVTQGSVLTAGISDEDGITGSVFSYQWKRGGANIPGATSITYQLVQADVGSTITVTVSYTDDLSTVETITSGATAVVSNTNDVGVATISGLAEQGSVLSVSVVDIDGTGGSAFSYQWRRGVTNIVGATAGTYEPVQADVGSSLSVRVQYTDDQGTSENIISNTTAAIANTNDTGVATISGTATQGSFLTASVTDEDGISANILYQWKRNGINISAADTDSYELTQADVGSTVTVAVSYTDDYGTFESVTSAPTVSVNNINDVGVVNISGSALQNQILTAVLNDADGTTGSTFSYQWIRSGTDITGANASTYQLVQADVGKKISVRVSYVDDLGAAENPVSAATINVVNVNDAGNVTITGTATQGSLLTANVSDVDGISGSISYQWNRGGSAISGATGNAYVLVQDDVGTAITVSVNYTDDQSTVENLTSLATNLVDNVNDIGVATIIGAASQGVTLNVTVADIDGTSGSIFSYQWKRGGADIAGAASASYMLTQVDVGSTITVTVSYTDDLLMAETITSAATSSVANVNDAGIVTISGSASQNQILTANIIDIDGTASSTFSYQWKRSGVNILGATQDSYQLEQADVGSTITVAVSYIDDQGTAENITSTATGVVTNVNETGVVSITGLATQNQILTADVTDDDGVSTSVFTYQWKRGGVDIPGASLQTYTLVQADVGSVISVVISYTDDQGTLENISSPFTSTVSNVNDTGSALITGVATEGSTLTANVTDEDGTGGSSFSYQWRRDGGDILGANAQTYTLVQSDVGSTIAVNVIYTDTLGASENITSPATTAVTNVNDTGIASISGSTVQGAVLSATVSDPDGTTSSVFSYQWKREGVAIAGATASSYSLLQADVGATITVTVGYVDDQGSTEDITSTSTAVISNVNDTGVASITGAASQGATLTAGITDADGISGSTFSYQWKRSGINISGADTNNYVLTQEDVTHTITVTINYTDDLATFESVTSPATAVVTNVNDAPVIGGVVPAQTVNDNATILPFSTVTIEDIDGDNVSVTITFDNKNKGVFTNASLSTSGFVGTGANPQGKNGKSPYTLAATTAAQAQAAIRQLVFVPTENRVDAGTTETTVFTIGVDDSFVTTNDSNTSVISTSINDAGSVSIAGGATQGSTLSANISDADGTTGSVFNYQWKRNGVDIAGATAANYMLMQADVNNTITVSVSYTDDLNTVENISSAATAVVSNVNDLGVVTISGSTIQGAVLTAAVLDADGTSTSVFTYQWRRNGSVIADTNASTYLLTQSDVGFSISVSVSYNDDFATAELITSAATAVIGNTNDIGIATISGTASQGNVLSASISDADGITGSVFSYQWKRSGADIIGATSNTYTLVQADVNSTITVSVDYTDDLLTAESISSAATGIVANINDTGIATIAGVATQGNTLTAGISDIDGTSTSSPVYQWKRNNADIVGATASTYVLSQDDVGNTLTVTISYTDDFATAENVTSAATAVVANVNDIGIASISGTASQGNQLTASVSDADGTSTSVFSYQWKRGGLNIAGANSQTYTLVQADAQQMITVTISYTDDLLTPENITSPAIGPVTDINDTGVAFIDGTPVQGGILSADVIDIDGTTTSAFTYQWRRDGINISGATSATYTLVQVDVNKNISVRVSYIDDGGTSENITSEATAAVANVNDIGQAIISGTVSQGNILTATVNDIDGTGGSVFTYQWRRNGVDITGATASTYLLVQDDVNKLISVRIQYSDDFAFAEDITSVETSAVTNINDPGLATISGILSQGNTLLASLLDIDGTASSTLSYQWRRNGVDIIGANSLVYQLRQLDVGAVISVTISYIDDFGTSESVTSPDTTAIGNLNDSGIASIIGTTGEGHVLTAVVSDLDGTTNSVFSYQWRRDGVNIPGAVAETYTILSIDIGSTISVVVSYIDDLGGNEIVTSAETAVIFADLDVDGTPDALDSDIDGDGIDNVYEESVVGLDPRDPADASGDLDGDGLTNLEEFLAGNNPVVDDNPPLVIAPSDITVNASGWFTSVDIGTAIAVDALSGQLTVFNDVDVNFRPGTTTVIWTAADDAGNVGFDIQLVNVIPLAETDRMQTAAEGNDALFSIYLNGDAVQYPVEIPYFVSGTAATDGSDHDLINGIAIIDEPSDGELPKVDVPFSIVDDGVGEGLENIVITLGQPVNAALGSAFMQSIDVVEGNVPPTLTLEAFQLVDTLQVDQVSGDVIVRAIVSDVNSDDSHSYDWSGTDNAIIEKDNGAIENFVFDPQTLSPGFYTIRVTVSDGIESVSDELMLRVISEQPELTVRDSDDDNIDDLTEGYGDDDNDGVVNYLDAISADNVIQILPTVSGSFLLQVESGLKVTLGEVAFKADQGGSLVDQGDILNFSSLPGLTADEFENVGGYFDFAVTGIPVAGQSVLVVIPQLEAMPRVPVYRKLTANGWQNFVKDSKNAVYSAPGSPGFCPPPGDTQYQPGLRQGHWCLQLLIEDGGPNDNDRVANNKVSDPGGIARILSDVSVSSSGGGGGSLTPMMSVLSVFIMLCLRSNTSRRRLVSTRMYRSSSIQKHSAEKIAA